MVLYRRESSVFIRSVQKRITRKGIKKWIMGGKREKQTQTKRIETQYICIHNETG